MTLEPRGFILSLCMTRETSPGSPQALKGLAGSSSSISCEQRLRHWPWR